LPQNGSIAAQTLCSGPARPEADLKAYTILVSDRRFPQALVLNAEMRDDRRAREFARDRFASSPHIAAVEVWDAAKCVGCFGTPEQSPAPQAA
jgi:hypothetical protein